MADERPEEIVRNPRQYTAKQKFSETEHDSIDTETLGNAGRDGNSINEVVGDGIWTWWNDPRAIQYNGTTYIGWVTSRHKRGDGFSDIIVGSINHSDGSITTNNIGTVTADDHNNPSLLIDNNGYIWAFWSEHAREQQFYYRVSSNVEDITSFNAEQTVSTSGDVTYPSPIQFTDGTIRLFARGIGNTYGYIETTDGGSTWGNETGVFDGSGYAKIAHDGSTLHFAHTSGTNTGHPRKEGGTSGQYVRYEYSTNSYATAGGSSLTTPIGDEGGDVFWDASSRGYASWAWDCAVDSDGNPRIVFAAFPGEGDSPQHWGSHEYWYAARDGGAWTVNKLTESSYHVNYQNERQYSTGIYLNPKDPSEAYAAVGDHRASRIQRWQTDDKGATWTYTNVTGSQQQNIRPVVAENFHDDAKLFWASGRYGDFDGDYLTSIKYSDGTAVPEAASPSISYDRIGGAYLYQQTTQSVGSGSYANIEFDTVRTNGRGIVDEANGRVEVDQPGYYDVTIHVRMGPFNNAANTVYMELFTDTNSYNWMLDEKENVASGDVIYLKGSVTVPARISDRFLPRIKHDSGTAEDINPAGDNQPDTYMHVVQRT